MSYVILELWLIGKTTLKGNASILEVSLLFCEKQ